MQPDSHSAARFAIIAALTLLLMACDVTQPQLATRLEPGDVFPHMRLPGLEPEQPSMPSLKGRVVVLNIWAPWCPPCVDEMPSLDRLSRSLDPGKVTVIGVTVDDRYLAQEFLRKNDIAFDSYFDQDRKQVEQVLGVTVYPETFIIGPDGLIHARITGWQEWDSDAIKRELLDLYRIR